MHISNNYSPSETQLVLLEWGLLDLRSISCLDAIRECGYGYYREFISQCNDRRLSWHDIAMLDLLLTKNFPEKQTWRVVDVQHCDSQLKELCDKSAEFWSASIQENLLRRDEYDDVITKVDKNILCARISKPEVAEACYIVGLLKKNCFFISGRGRIEWIVDVLQSLYDEIPFKESLTRGDDDTPGSQDMQMHGVKTRELSIADVNQRCKLHNLVVRVGVGAAGTMCCEATLHGRLALLGSNIGIGVEVLQKYGVYDPPT